jgi:hypothetical protein
MRWLVATIFGELGALCAAAALPGPKPAPKSGVDFTRDVRPILAQNCLKCHGPDDKQRQAGLRLDVREGALAGLKSGRRAIVPGKPGQSEMVRRIFADGPLMMPPAHSNKSLTPSQKETLKRWVAAGAPYQQHWAFIPPTRAPMPKVKLTRWPRNPIDAFILAKVEQAGLKPSPEADRYTLVRRVYLDLIGLPPTPEEADAFVNDRRPDAYERLVDKLLTSPHYGERWARRWLDLARYADTNGFEKDRPRSIWPYRDWVINALNTDMPFDQFTVEQIAGDMLPSATQSQRIATGFHRNTMLNEEGGIDPLEYRFYSVVDRINTTGATWLGLTVGCAQCHTHKFDPITQNEYYRLMAFLNNADEPEMEVPTREIAAKRKEIESEAARREAALADKFPPAQTVRWVPAEEVQVVSATSEAGATIKTLPDGSLLVQGNNPEADTYTVVLQTRERDISGVRVEALTDSSLSNGGPGRTPHGNFVLTEVGATVGPAWTEGSAASVKFAAAETDFAQDGFPAANVIDGNPKTGWAIHGDGNWNVNRALSLRTERPTGAEGASRWTFRIAQTYGGRHTLGRFRIRLGQTAATGKSGRENLSDSFNAWLKVQETRATRWTVLRPVKAASNTPLLTVLEDDSVLASGDQTKRDLYDLDFRTDLKGTTAIRLEVLPDERLPKRGPGRTWYEGQPGDFFMSEVTMSAGRAPVKIGAATASFGNTPAAAIDGDPQTGWSIPGGQGRAHTAVFNLAQPISGGFSLKLLFERYYASGLGRFRVSITTDERSPKAGLPADVEAVLTTPAEQRTAPQDDRMLAYFLSVAPELASEREAIKKLRDSMPAYPTTLAFQERPANNPRATFVHHRGEFLQPAEKVEPGVLSVLPSLPEGAPRNRLTFAKWLVDPRNPLVGRVTMNRQWEAFFGQGIVKTVADFGYPGEAPTHPELLDWLAVELVKQGWSMKKMHRLIVTSATYRQSSRVTPELAARDPENKLLARGPRVRLEAELLRDTALKASGLLSGKIGGPSVFPPQPAGVTTMGVYGPLEWKVSQGEDRYRRGLYTFAKRTAPYAMFSTFDAPSGEATCTRREVSNTPLQALATLNDEVFVEAAQALGTLMASRPGSVEERASYLFRRCLTRPPKADEVALLVRFYEGQKQRFVSKEIDPATVAGPGEGDVAERAAWTALARSLLNVDEAVVKP